MSFSRRLDAARKFGGARALFNDSSAQLRGVHAQYPASYPKYSLDNTLQGALETGFRLFLPVSSLLRANPRDKDILKPLINNQYIEMIVTQVQEQFNERVEVKNLVNGAFATYYYGTAPPQFSFAGHLLNDFQDDWRNKMLRLYSRYIRGTNLSKVGRQVVVSYADIVVTGECTSLTTGLTGEGETHGTFNLSMIVHRMSVKRSPLVSDFNTKDTTPLTQPGSPILFTKKKIQAGVRGSGNSDIFTQTKMLPGERRRRSQLLEQQKSSLQAAVVNAQTRLSGAQQAYNTYQRANQGNPFDATGLSLLSQVRSSQSDLTTAQRQVSEVTRKQKELLTGIAQRDTLQRRRNTQTTTPGRVIELPATKKPPINRRVGQATGVAR